jgi:hypothetical protein
LERIRVLIAEDHAAEAAEEVQPDVVVQVADRAQAIVRAREARTGPQSAKH